MQILIIGIYLLPIAGKLPLSTFPPAWIKNSLIACNNESEPMTARILRYSDLETQLGMNRVTIWRRTRTDPTFPRPIRLGNAGSRNAAIGFLAEEVEAWIALQAATARVER